MENNDLYKSLIQGSRRSLAKAITLIESTSHKDQEKASELLEKIYPKTGNSIRIGISGVPGVGKSTFIEKLGGLLIEQGKKIAVLAVDPSSPISGGSILGDKTRMTDLAKNNNAFIRPTATAGKLGGLANKTRENILLCEAAGYNVILIETVGVGQSEIDVAYMVDLFLLLMLPNAGDEIQGLKKGILELVDFIIVNKNDGVSKDLATKAMALYHSAIQIIQGHEEVNISTCSSLTGMGIENIWKDIESTWNKRTKSKKFQENRQDQNVNWMNSYFNELLTQEISQNGDFIKSKNQLENDVREGKILALNAAPNLIKILFSQ